LDKFASNLGLLLSFSGELVLQQCNGGSETVQYKLNIISISVQLQTKDFLVLLLELSIILLDNFLKLLEILFILHLDEQFFGILRGKQFALLLVDIVQVLQLVFELLEFILVDRHYLLVSLVDIEELKSIGVFS
jgi:hypothetical protein